VHAALLGRPLICWDHDELLALREAVPHPDWPNGSSPAERRPNSVRLDATLWRAQLDDPPARTLAGPGQPGPAAAAPAPSIATAAAQARSRGVTVRHLASETGTAMRQTLTRRPDRPQ
jgi:hypothetical protein